MVAIAYSETLVNFKMRAVIHFENQFSCKINLFQTANILNKKYLTNNK